MKKERTGSLIWRLIYPLLIFLGVELIIELGATIVYFAVKMQSGAFENLSEQGIVDAATAFLPLHARHGLPRAAGAGKAPA